MNTKLATHVPFHSPFSQSEMQLSRAFLCCADRPLVSYFFSTCAEHIHYSVKLLRCIFRTAFPTSSNWPSKTVHNKTSFIDGFHGVWLLFRRARVRVCICCNCVLTTGKKVLYWVQCWKIKQTAPLSINCTAAFWSPVRPLLPSKKVGYLVDISKARLSFPCA